MAENELQRPTRRQLLQYTAALTGAVAFLNSTCKLDLPTVKNIAPVQGKASNNQSADILFIDNDKDRFGKVLEDNYKNAFGVDIESRDLEETDWSSLDKHTAVIVGEGADNPKKLDQIKSFAQKGGSVLFIKPKNPEMLAEAGLGPIDSEGEAGHIVSDGRKLRYHGRASYHTEVADGVHVLARFKNGAPAITNLSVGEGNFGVAAWQVPKSWAYSLYGDPQRNQNDNPQMGFRWIDRFTGEGADGKPWVDLINGDDNLFVDEQSRLLLNLLKLSKLRPMVIKDQGPVVAILTSDAHGGTTDHLQKYLSEVERIGATADIFWAPPKDFSALPIASWHRLHNFLNPDTDINRHQPNQQWIQEHITNKGHGIKIHPYLGDFGGPYNNMTERDVRRGVEKANQEFSDKGFPLSDLTRIHAAATTSQLAGEAKVLAEMDYKLLSAFYTWGPKFRDNPEQRLFRGSLRPRHFVGPNGEYYDIWGTGTTIVDEDLCRVEPVDQSDKTWKNWVANLPIKRAKEAVTSILERYQRERISPIGIINHADYLFQEEPYQFFVHIIDELQRLGIQAMSAEQYLTFLQTK